MLANTKPALGFPYWRGWPDPTCIAFICLYKAQTLEVPKKFRLVMG